MTSCALASITCLATCEGFELAAAVAVACGLVVAAGEAAADGCGVGDTLEGTGELTDVGTGDGDDETAAVGCVVGVLLFVAPFVAVFSAHPASVLTILTITTAMAIVLLLPMRTTPSSIIFHITPDACEE